jgi:hypothetical protein
MSKTNKNKMWSNKNINKFDHTINFKRNRHWNPQGATRPFLCFVLFDACTTTEKEKLCHDPLALLVGLDRILHCLNIICATEYEIVLLNMKLCYWI